jgi:hypothetical protein
MDAAVWDVTVFTKNRYRLLQGDVAREFPLAVLADRQVTPLLSSEHFSVDGTLIAAWASMRSFQPQDGSGKPPGDVRRILYTTNAIEALNSKLRRAVRARGHFPSDEAATKLLFLVLNRSEKEWIMPPREWAMAKSQFAILFGERFTVALA